MFKLTHKEEDYYAMFGTLALCAAEAAARLEALIRDYRDAQKAIDEIEAVEHRADERVRAINDQLNRSFITPIDREDIFQIARKLDRIVDVVDSTAARFLMYNVTVVASDAKDLSAHVVKTVGAVVDLVSHLRAHKPEAFGAAVELVDSLEHEGDDLYRSAMRRLFTDEPDAVEVVKWKEIYEMLEKAIDACEDVAHVIHGVVVKNS
jgi:predicted phosphate transport protein (TIGR00153 family)